MNNDDEDTMLGDNDKRHSSGYTIWKEIVGTMIGIAPFALAFFLWMSSVQTRLAVLEEARVTQNYRDNAQDAALNIGMSRIEAAQLEIKQGLREIDKYLRDNTVRR